MAGVGVSGQSLSGRSSPRAQVTMPCRVSWPGVEVVALTRDLSPEGLAVSLSDDAALEGKEKVHIYLHERIALQAVPVHSRREPGRLVAGFKVHRIKQGAREWNQLIDGLQRYRRL